MIVKNEELTLKKCLNSVKTLVDEIIIVDTGSLDRTKKIATEFTDKVFNFKWIDDFSAARNFSFNHASMDYILWLDADDILLPEDIIKFQKLKENLSCDTSVVMLKYNTGFDNYGNVNFSCFRERLVKRTAGLKWKEPVHEYIETHGKVIIGDACITHTKKPRISSSRNLNIYEKIIKNNGKLSPRGTYYYARELKDAGRYADAAKHFETFLNLKKGWIEDNISACGALCECLTLLNDRHGAFQALVKSFEYDIPRPEICCQLGYYFKQAKKYRQAAYWFELALNFSKNNGSLGFWQEDYTGYIPCIELSVCYDRLSDYQKAFEFNEKAAVFKPDCPAVLSNRKYLKKIIKPHE